MPCVLRSTAKSSFIWFSAHCTTQHAVYNQKTGQNTFSNLSICTVFQKELHPIYLCKIFMTRAPMYIHNFGINICEKICNSSCMRCFLRHLNWSGWIMLYTNERHMPVSHAIWRAVVVCLRCTFLAQNQVVHSISIVTCVHSAHSEVNHFLEVSCGLVSHSYSNLSNPICQEILKNEFLAPQLLNLYKFLMKMWSLMTKNKSATLATLKLVPNC